MAVRQPAGHSVAAIERPFGTAPLVLVCEHASNHLPGRFGTLGLSEEERRSHIAWDPGALGVARGLSKALDAPLVFATVSRLVLDLNREPGAVDSIATVSERTRIPGNETLSDGERASRVVEIYDGFHDAVAAFLDGRAAPTVAVVSVHSFTPVYKDVPRPWHVGLIHAEDDRLARRVGDGLRRDAALVVGMNEPYSPADRVFHTLDRHAVRRGLAPLMIEIRNDLIRDPAGEARWAHRLSPLVDEAVKALGRSGS